MTNRERQIFELIRKQPSISQKEIAEKLNLTRTSVAVHITHIVEKGFILGRQYIIRENPLILVVGACNVDIQGFPKNNFELYNSNIGEVKITHGGVGRNIAVNTNCLIKNTKLISVLSTDRHGQDILNDLTRKGIDVDDVLVSDSRMSTYLSLFDNKNELISAISDMKLVNELTPEFLRTKEEILKNVEYLVVDTNLPQESIEYIASVKGEKTKLFVDTVSIEKAKKIKNILNKITVLKTNRLELEAITGSSLKKIRDIKKACKELLAKGVEKIFVTLGSDGVVYSDCTKTAKLSNPKDINVLDVNGAGDMFTSALIYAELSRLNIEKMVKFAQCASIYKLGIKGTTSKDFGIDKIYNVANKYYPEISKGDFFNEL